VDVLRGTRVPSLPSRRRLLPDRLLRGSPGPGDHWHPAQEQLTHSGLEQQAPHLHRLQSYCFHPFTQHRPARLERLARAQLRPVPARSQTARHQPLPRQKSQVQDRLGRLPRRNRRQLRRSTSFTAAPLAATAVPGIPTPCGPARSALAPSRPRPCSPWTARKWPSSKAGPALPFSTC